MYGEKSGRKVITKETIAAELLAKPGSSWRGYLFLAVGSFVTVALLFLCVFFFGMKGHNLRAFGYILYFVTLTVCLAPIRFFLKCIPASLTAEKKLKALDFYVITDEVAYKEERRRMPSRTYRIDKILHFYDCGDVIVSNTQYELAEAHDRFYIVVLDLDAKIPQKCYPAKFFEYKE